MAFRQDPHLEGKPRSKRSDADKFRILGHHTLAFRKFLSEDITIDAPFFLLIMGAAAVEFRKDGGWNNRKCDQLRMAMFQGRASRRAMVLKDENIAKATVFF